MKLRTIFLLLALAVATTAFAQQNKRIAILETVDKEESVPYGVKLLVRCKLSDIITSTPGYEAYDRVDIASIMSEHDFQKTGLVNDLDLKKLGEMTGADYVLVAEVAKLDSSHFIIASKILDVETAQVIRTSNVQTTSTAEELDKNCRLLAQKLLDIPLSYGELNIDGDRYVGEYRNGKPHGKGTMYYESGSHLKSYNGEWVNGIREGKGTLIWTDGRRYEGQWYNDKKQGKGTFYWANGDRYVGDWANDNFEGYATIYRADGSIDCKGRYVNGKAEGNWTFYTKNGQINYIEVYKNGEYVRTINY